MRFDEHFPMQAVFAGLSQQSARFVAYWFFLTPLSSKVLPN
ncbi:MAG: hypothetical protein ACJA0U_003204 [Salibacteraceae bacterium]|jgi:hypothetical protein